jgi:hypothetical protein
VDHRRQFRKSPGGIDAERCLVVLDRPLQVVAGVAAAAPPVHSAQAILHVGPFQGQSVRGEDFGGILIGRDGLFFVRHGAPWPLEQGFAQVALQRGPQHGVFDAGQSAQRA